MVVVVTGGSVVVVVDVVVVVVGRRVVVVVVLVVVDDVVVVDDAVDVGTVVVVVVVVVGLGRLADRDADARPASNRTNAMPHTDRRLSCRRHLHERAQFPLDVRTARLVEDLAWSRPRRWRRAGPATRRPRRSR